MSIDISRELLQRIWTAHHLGDIHQVMLPEHGALNQVHIVNDTHVIRFDVLDYAFDRFQAEHRMYSRLRGSGVPVPGVTAIDASKTIAPYRYIILTKMPGTPISTGWHALSSAQQAQVGQDVGNALWLIHHSPGFARAGMLFKLEHEGVSNWHQYVFNRLYTNTEAVRTLNILDAARSQRMHAIFERYRTLLESLDCKQPVHGDFSMDNLHQQAGKLTAVLDFEWAHSGDPAWDFRLEEKWEDACPGIRGHIYQGYSTHQPVEPDFDCRVRLYKLLQNIDDVLFYGDEHLDETEYQRTLLQLDACIESFD